MLKSGGGHLEQVPLVPPALPEELVTSLAPPLKSAAERATGQTRAKWVQKKNHKKIGLSKVSRCRSLSPMFTRPSVPEFQKATFSPLYCPTAPPPRSSFLPLSGVTNL